MAFTPTVTEAIHQYGTGLTYSLTEAGVYADMGQVRKVVAPKKKGTKADGTHLRSPNFTKEQVQSWAEPGDAGVTLVYTPEVYATLVGLQEAQTTIYCRYELPPGGPAAAYIPFRAQITGVSMADAEAGADKIHEIEVEFAVQGSITSFHAPD